MQKLIDEQGRVRTKTPAEIAREFRLGAPDFDVASWAIRALGWVELTLAPERRSARWCPLQVNVAAAREARRLLLDDEPLAPIEIVRWTDRWHAETTDGMGAAWALGAAIDGAGHRPQSWTMVRRSVGDLYRDRDLALIEDLSRVAGRRIDRGIAAEIVEQAPSGLVGMVEREGPGEPFRYLRIGRDVPVFDRPEAFIGHDLRESSDPAFSAASVPAYEAAASSDDPVIEDIEGRIQFPDGRMREVAYRRVLLRVVGSAGGRAIVMKTSTWLRPPVPAAA